MKRQTPEVMRREQDWPAGQVLRWNPRELERMRGDGAAFIAFAWPAFWWFNHYKGLIAHLESRYRRVPDTERIRLFDLREARIA